MSALAAQIGIADETTFGTIATPTMFPEFVDESIKATYARIESNGLRAGRLYRSGTRFTTYQEGASGDINMEVGSKGFGKFLKHMLGAVSSSAVVDSATTHTFTPGDLDSKSFTCQVGRPPFAGGPPVPFTYAGCSITEWELSNDNEGNLMAKTGVDAATEDTATALAAVSYPTGIETLSWAGALITIAGTQFDATNATITGNNGLATDRRFLRRNTAKKKQVRNDYAAGGFTLEGEFDSLTQRARVASATAAGAMAQIVCSWRGLTLIGTTTYPELKVTLNARFDEFEANVSGPEGIMQTLTGVYLDTNAISVDYVTTDLAAAV